MINYKIFDADAVQQRIGELENTHNASWEHDLGEIKALKQILSNSVPLIPEIEKSWDSGQEHGICDWADIMEFKAPIDKRQYISQLKFSFIDEPESTDGMTDWRETQN